MSKVACETAAELPVVGAGAVQLCVRGGAGSASPSADEDDAGAPAESVLLRVPDGGGGFSLTHLFGAALRRDGSTKGSSNPKAAAEEAAATRKGAPPPRLADSRRLPAARSKTAAVVIGVLPASKERRRVPGRVVVAARAWRRPAAGARIFASEAVVGPEPVSPKVSCFGAVLSSERSAAAAAAAPGTGTGTQEEKQGSASGCWASLGTALVGLLCDDSDAAREGHASEPNSKATAAAPEPHQRVVAAAMSPPRPAVAGLGLGDVKRLASRRWPDTMARGAV